MQLNVGYNFDRNLPQALSLLNNDPDILTQDKITSVYGSIREHAWLSARPDFRLPDIPVDEMATQIQMLKGYGIDFNYTLNSPNPGNSKAELMEREEEFLKICYLLADIGVSKFIISNPILIEILRRKAPSIDVGIELSTIMHVDTPMQLLGYRELDPRINRVVGNILYNRDFAMLEKFVKASNMTGIEYEVMVNEFCLNATGKAELPIAAHCVFRDSCYNCHAGNKTKDDALALHNYPMGKCMTSRAFLAADWLRTFTARPQDLHYYENIGINHFKITGRTGSTGYILTMAKAYLSRKFDGNYLDLWKPLQTIYNGKAEADHKHPFYIMTSEMDGFMDPFVNGEINCRETFCHECMYCDEWAARVAK